jgi:hypothetical protein
MPRKRERLHLAFSASLDAPRVCHRSVAVGPEPVHVSGNCQRLTLPARNNLGKSWQLPYQPIHARERALTTGLVPAEVVSFALFVVAVRSYAVFRQDFSAISHRLNHESHRPILEFISSLHFR